MSRRTKYRRRDKAEPNPVGELVEPPAWLTEAQKSGWKYAIENAPAGLLKKLDRSVLVTWVVAEDLHRRASEQVEKFGILTKSPNTGTPIQSPYLSILNRQAQIMLKAVEQLGFSPSSRSRVQMAKTEAPDLPDDWAYFANR